MAAIASYFCVWEQGGGGGGFDVHQIGKKHPALSRLRLQL